MFQPRPPQTRHRRMQSGTMVSYAEVKSYLSKREIPQLFESLMAGLMYHRPENHIGYLQSCLDEVKTSNNESKIHWSTFVNKKRKSKEILPPLTPAKQESSVSSWSDNSRQSTPLPPISAKTRTRTSDLKNTYILYHNPPPILSKPRVPVVFVLGGLGTRIDELCEKVVMRLRGVVHISTCSMLKTRMTIEGFYRMTSVPACAVVDSVLQAMSMVQSENALMIAGFPRHRGDIEEYRSRNVRLDGVVLVDFEEDSLRRFLKTEVSSGLIRVTDIEAELERYKQDIISVAEYYDQKELLTVVMGDQDNEEMVEDIVIAIDKVVEERKHAKDDDLVIDGIKDCEFASDGPCNALIPSPNGVVRPSTVEIRDATEEDIKLIEASSRNSGEIDAKENENGVVPEVDGKPIEGDVVTPGSETSVAVVESEAKVPGMESETDAEAKETLVIDSTESKSDVAVGEQPIVNGIESEDKDKAKELQDGKASDTAINPENQNDIPGKEGDGIQSEVSSPKEDSAEVKQSSKLIAFAFENIKFDQDSLKNLIVNDLGMCFIDFNELVRNDGEKDDKLNSAEALNLLQCVLRKDPTQHSNGFFISDFPFILLKETKFESILQLGEVSFVCKIREKSSEAEQDAKQQQEELLFESPMSERVRIIFVTESNLTSELKSSLQEIVSNSDEHVQNCIEVLNGTQDKAKEIDEGNIEKPIDLIDSETKIEAETEEENGKVTSDAGNVSDKQKEEDTGDVVKESPENLQTPETDLKAVDQESMVETSRDETEESTCQDVEDLITDNTLDEDIVEEIKESEDKNLEIEDTLSEVSEEKIVPVDAYKEKAVLERQQNLDIETTSASESTTQLLKGTEETLGAEDNTEAKSRIIRQATFLSTNETIPESDELLGENLNGAENNRENIEIGTKESRDANNKIEANDVEHEFTDNQDSKENSEKSESVQNVEGDASAAEEIAPEEIKETENNDPEDVPVPIESSNDLEEGSSKPFQNEDSSEDSQIQLDKATDELNHADENVVVDTSKDDADIEGNETIIENVEQTEATNDSNADSEPKAGEVADNTGKESENLEKNEENSETNEDKSEVDASEKECNNGNEDDKNNNDVNQEDSTNDEEKNASDSNEPTNVEEAINEEGATSDNNSAANESEENSQTEVSNPDVTSNEETTVPQNLPGTDAETIAATEITKSVENDSDSNDENGEKSITIETQAEVHAPDSQSPPLLESDQHNTKNVDEANDNVQDTSIAKDNEESVENENNCNEVVDTPRDTTTDKDIISENTDDAQITTVREMNSLENERYSAKLQERNGSGILGDGRQDNHSETEDPPERSSSSSRGEL